MAGRLDAARTGLKQKFVKLVPDGAHSPPRLLCARVEPTKGVNSAVSACASEAALALEEENTAGGQSLSGANGSTNASESATNDDHVILKVNLGTGPAVLGVGGENRSKSSGRHVGRWLRTRVMEGYRWDMEREKS